MQAGTHEDVLPFGGGIDASLVVQALRKCDEAVRRLGAMLPHVRLALILHSRHKGSAAMHHTKHTCSRRSRLSQPSPCAEGPRQLLQTHGTQTFTAQPYPSILRQAG